MIRRFCILALIAAAARGGGLETVFSRDGRAVLAGPRELPVQGVRLSDGAVLVGLPARGTNDWVACGYWPVLRTPAPAPVSNEVYRTAGWTLDPARLVASPVWRPYVPRPPRVEYSKRLLYRALLARGVWPRVRALLEESGAWEDWTYATTLEAGDPLMQSSVEAVRELLGHTAAQMAEMLRQCVAR